MKHLRPTTYPLLVLWYLIFHCSCNRAGDDIFSYNWEIIDPVFDSCAHHIEQAYLSDGADSMLLILTDSLSLLSSDARTGPLEMRQLKARSHYWQAQLAERMRLDDLKMHHLNLALAMGDSAKYPYDHMKFKVAYCYPPRNYDEYVTSYLTLCEAMDYFTVHHEPIYRARIGVHISNLLREARLYSEADTFMKNAEDTYRRFGLTDMVIKSKLNFANILSETDPDSSVSILTDLMEDPVAKNDFFFYNTVLRNYYLLTGDSAALFNAYRQIESLEGYTAEKAFFMAKIADYYLNASPVQNDSAYKYINLSLALVDSLDIEKYKTTIFRTSQSVYEARGEYDLAYKYLNQYAMMMEKDLSRSRSMAKEEKRDAILLMDKNNEHKRTIQNFQFAIVIISILLLILVVGIFLYLRIMRQRNKLIKATEERNHRGRKIEGMAVNLQEKELVLEKIEKRIQEMRDDKAISSPTARDLLSILKMHSMRQEERQTFQEIHQSLNPEFYSKLRADFPTITENDIRFAALIAIGLTNNEIAAILMIRYQSVKNYRYRLKQKMNLDKDSDLNNVIRRYAQKRSDEES